MVYSLPLPTLLPHFKGMFKGTYIVFTESIQPCPYGGERIQK